MTRRKATVTEKGGIIVVRGWQVGSILSDAGLKGVYSASAGGHMLDSKRLPDVMAALEHRSIATVYVDGDAGPDGDAS